jgi:hypothetical protein
MPQLITLSNPLELIPVLEEAYLTEARIEGIEPISPDSGFVPLSRLTEPLVLRGLVQAEAQRRKIAPEQLQTPFCGGYILRSNGAVAIWPTCCGDLGNLLYWKQASAYREAQWQQLYIGHPWVCVRFTDGSLTISEENEQEVYELPLSAARYTVSPSLLEAAIKQAQNEVELFAERLRPAVQMLTSATLAPKITQYLVGLT